MTHNLRTHHEFLGLDSVSVDAANVVLFPLPYEGTVSYGSGTERGPAAILRASTEVELWDEELEFSLDVLGYHTAGSLTPMEDNTPKMYLPLVQQHAKSLSRPDALLMGIGGEHSLTPPLVRAACESRDVRLDQVTVVQIDAHADLRDEYEGTPLSHACAMRRLTEEGARLIAIGIRSGDRTEFQYADQSRNIQTFTAQQLATNEERERDLRSTLTNLHGDVYLTIDIDGLDVSLCPGTGTPQPGGLDWWQTLRYLRDLLLENPHIRLIGCDIVETTPMPNTQVNEFVAARLAAKVIGYWFCRSR